MATEVCSPINRKTTPGLPTSPGSHSLKNRFATNSQPSKSDSEPSQPQVTAGDKGISRPGSVRHGGTRDDSGLSAAQQHLARHRLAQLGREDR
jgi:hypothetical protein